MCRKIRCDGYYAKIFGIWVELNGAIITRTMQRVAHSVLIFLLSMSGKWGRSVLVVYLLNLCSGMHIALFGPVYIHAVTHLKDDISIHNRDLCIHAAVHLNI